MRTMLYAGSEQNLAQVYEISYTSVRQMFTRREKVHGEECVLNRGFVDTPTPLRNNHSP